MITRVDFVVYNTGVFASNLQVYITKQCLKASVRRPGLMLKQKKKLF